MTDAKRPLRGKHGETTSRKINRRLNRSRQRSLRQEGRRACREQE